VPRGVVQQLMSHYLATSVSFAAGILSSLLAQEIWGHWERWKRRRGRRRAAHELAAKGQLASTDRGFLRIGTTSVPWVVCAMAPWAPSQIVCRYNPTPVPLVEPVQQCLEELKRELGRRSETGERVPFNGLGYKLESFDVSQRMVPDELALLYLTFRPTDYFTMLATDHRLDDPIVVDGAPTTLRETYAKDVDLRIHPVDEFATHFGVAIQIVTSDNLMIISERGNTAVDAGVFFPSVAEGGSRPVDGDDRQVPHPNRIAVRGIYEELAVEVLTDEINWVSFGANAVLCEYGMIGWVRTQLSWEQILERREAGLPKDLWESTRLHAVPFGPKPVARFVGTHGPWSPFALVAIYHTLLAEFSWDSVHSAFAKAELQLSEQLPPSTS
jgi:hypothetical protein